MRAKPRWTSTNESGERCLDHPARPQGEADGVPALVTVEHTPVRQEAFVGDQHRVAVTRLLSRDTVTDILHLSLELVTNEILVLGCQIVSST